MNLITSSNNPVIKEIKALKSRKIREKKKLFFIEGIRIVEEAFNEEADIVTLFLSEQFMVKDEATIFLNMIEERKLAYYIVSEKLFKEISDTETPQGIMAIIRIKEAKLDEIINQDSSLIILDKIQDPGNIGTIIRTADAAGFDGIIISKGCVDVYNPKVVRSTMGSIFRMPFYYSEKFEDTINVIKNRGIKLIAAHLKGDKNYFEFDLTGGTAIIIGNEANGISDDIAALADSLVLIPMIGRTESLNASVAASLLIYEVLRQKILKS